MIVSLRFLGFMYVITALLSYALCAGRLARGRSGHDAHRALQQSPISQVLCVAVSVGLVRPPEGDGLADVLAGSECIQDEAGYVGSRNRRRDGARADPCGVAAGACSRRQAGRTGDGVVEAALTDRLLLQGLVSVRPSKEQGVEHALE